MQVRVDALSVELVARIVQHVPDVLGGAFNHAVRVDLEQGPANVGDVVLDRLEVGGLFRRVPVDGRFRQGWFGRGNFALLNRVQLARVAAVGRTLGAPVAGGRGQVTVALLQQATKLQTTQ